MDEQRVAVITGAAQGIGQRCAEILAERGYALALYDRQPCTVGAEHLAFTGDVTDEAEVVRFAAAVVARFGRADVLVNNAGISCIVPAEDLTAAQIRQVLEINLVGPFLMTQAIGRMMLRQRAGSIINIASVAGLLGISNRSVYNASKHGLIGMTRTLAAEWGGRGVRSNAVCPGWVKTPMDDSAQHAGLYQDADITGRVPMGRFASPDDIARAVAFLADPLESSFINGQTLAVDGGWTADGSWQSLRDSKAGN